MTYIAGVGDISTDLLSPGNQAHSRSDRELHGQCMITPEAQQEILALKEQHPDKKVMLIAEKGTMGVGSSRMSGVNNVALVGRCSSKPLCTFCKYCPRSCRHQWYRADLFNYRGCHRVGLVWIFKNWVTESRCRR